MIFFSAHRVSPPPCVREFVPVCAFSYTRKKVKRGQFHAINKFSLCLSLLALKWKPTSSNEISIWVMMVTFLIFLELAWLQVNQLSRAAPFMDNLKKKKIKFDRLYQCHRISCTSRFGLFIFSNLKDILAGEFCSMLLFWGGKILIFTLTLTFCRLLCSLILLFFFAMIQTARKSD